MKTMIERGMDVNADMVKIQSKISLVQRWLWNHAQNQRYSRIHRYGKRMCSAAFIINEVDDQRLTDRPTDRPTDGSDGEREARLEMQWPV